MILSFTIHQYSLKEIFQTIQSRINTATTTRSFETLELIANFEFSCCGSRIYPALNNLENRLQNIYA